MGNRINKMLGYGLTDVKTKKYRIDDSRFNPDFLDLIYEGDCSIYSVANYLDWLEKKKRDNEASGFGKNFELSLEILAIKNLEANKDLIYKQFNHCAELGYKKVCCIVPPSHKSWYRHDDIIDYTEACLSRKGAAPSLKLIPCGIYPYVASYMDKETGERLKNADDSLYHHFLSMKNSNIVFNEDQYSLMKEKYVPYVPECIRLYCEFVKMFSDPTVVFQLRPMRYVYWS